jgi:hypothetical protein
MPESGSKLSEMVQKFLPVFALFFSKQTQNHANKCCSCLLLVVVQAEWPEWLRNEVQSSQQVTKIRCKDLKILLSEWNSSQDPIADKRFIVGCVE